MRRIRHFSVLFVVLMFFYSSATPSQAKGPCDDPNIRNWANTVDRLFKNKPPWAQIYPNLAGSGHHVQIILELVEPSELKGLQTALAKMGFTQGDTSMGVQSWYSNTTWQNPCPTGGSPASQPATDRPPGDNGGWYALLLVVLAAALAIPFLGRQRQPA